MMIDGLEIRDETVHKAERLNEILKLKGSIESRYPDWVSRQGFLLFGLHVKRLHLRNRSS